MLGSATLTQPKLDTLRAVLGKHVGQNLDAKAQAAIASELSRKLGTKVAANEIPSLIRGYAAIGQRLEAQDGHQAKVGSSVGRTLTASSTAGDHRSRWNPRGAFAVQLAQVSNMVVGPETLISAVMRTARSTLADLASATLASSANAAKRGLAAAMIVGVIGGGVQTAAYAQELGTASVRTQHQAARLQTLEEAARRLTGDQKVYAVGNVQGHGLDQLEDYLRARAPNVTVIAVERADRTRDQLDNFVRGQLAAAPALRHRIDAATKQGNGMVILVSFGNAANASERSVHFWANDFYAQRHIRTTADIREAFRAPGNDATVDARVRSVVEHAQRVTGSAPAPARGVGAPSVQSVSSLDTTTVVAGGIGLLVAGLGIAAGLAALRRRRVGKEAQDAIVKVEGKVAERLEELKQCISDVQTNLGDSPQAVLDRFSDRTLAIAQELCNDIAELARMHGAIKVIKDEAAIFVAADKVSNAATRFLSSGKLQNALATATNREITFSPEKGLPNVIDESVGSPAWREAVEQGLKSFPAFTTSANKLLAAIDETSARVKKNSATIISAMGSDVKLFDLKTEHDALTKLVASVSANAKADGLFTFDLKDISAAVDKSIAAARAQFKRDPVGAFERGGETANRILDESAMLAHACVSAREQLLPVIDEARAALAKSGVTTIWLDDAVKAISDEVTKQANLLDDGSAKAGIDKVVADISALGARAQLAVELDQRRTGPATQALADAQAAIERTRSELARTLRMPASRLLQESGLSPFAHADQVAKLLESCKASLDVGKTDAASTSLDTIETELRTVYKLLEEATFSAANHDKNRGILRATQRDLDGVIEEHRAFLPRLRDQYHHSVLRELNGVEYAIRDAMEEAQHGMAIADERFHQGAVIGAARSVASADAAFGKVRTSLELIARVTSELETADQNNAATLRGVNDSYNALARYASGLSLLATTVGTVNRALAAIETANVALGAPNRNPYDVESLISSASLAVQTAQAAVTTEVQNRERAERAITSARREVERAQVFSKGRYSASAYGTCGADDFATALSLLEAGDYVAAAQAAARAERTAESNIEAATSAYDSANAVVVGSAVANSGGSNDSVVEAAASPAPDVTPTVSNETF